jgi:hypothetical protein
LSQRFSMPDAKSKATLNDIRYWGVAVI